MISSNFFFSIKIQTFQIDFFQKKFQEFRFFSRLFQTSWGILDVKIQMRFTKIFFLPIFFRYFFFQIFLKNICSTFYEYLKLMISTSFPESSQVTGVLPVYKINVKNSLKNSMKHLKISLHLQIFYSNSMNFL